MEIKKLLEEFDEVLQDNKERYLAVKHVGPAYPEPNGMYAKSPGLNVSLIENGEKVTLSNDRKYVGLSCLHDTKWSDEAIIKELQEYCDIPDDIEVRYLN